MVIALEALINIPRPMDQVNRLRMRNQAAFPEICLSLTNVFFLSTTFVKFILTRDRCIPRKNPDIWRLSFEYEWLINIHYVLLIRAPEY